jgi:hypothetical protein
MYLNRLWVQSSADSAVRAAGKAGPVYSAARIRALLTTWHPAAVVAVCDARSVLGRYLVSLLGQPAISGGGVLGWRLST